MFNIWKINKTQSEKQKKKKGVHEHGLDCEIMKGGIEVKCFVAYEKIRFGVCCTNNDILVTGFTRLKYWLRWSISTCWESSTGIWSPKTCWSDQTVTSCFPTSISLYAPMLSQPLNPLTVHWTPHSHPRYATLASTPPPSPASRTAYSGPGRSRPSNPTASSWPNRSGPARAPSLGPTSTCRRKWPPGTHTAMPSTGGPSGYSSTRWCTVEHPSRDHRTRLRCEASSKSPSHFPPPRPPVRLKCTRGTSYQGCSTRTRTAGSGPNEALRTSKNTPSSRGSISRSSGRSRRRRFHHSEGIKRRRFTTPAT